MKSPKKIQCKRVYDEPDGSDGFRVLVDKVWPRGIKKDALVMDEWCKTLAPSTALRQWFGHDPERWAAFYQKYHAELRNQAEAIEALLAACDGRTLTLLYAARDTEHNNALALKMYLER
jgi:uncharacterized protein YeaO (DUF488 family)